MAYDRDRENSYGGFQYRWNYDEYQKTLQKKRKKSAARGMRAFCLTTIFVFLLCTASLLVVLTASVLRGVLHTLPVPSDTEASGISLPISDGSADENTPAVPDTQEVPTDSLSGDALPPPVITDPAANTAPADHTEMDTSDVDESASESPSVLMSTAREESALPENTDYFAELTVSEIAEVCSASTVTVQCQRENGRAIGSGFILSEDGYIVTNRHVIEQYDEYQILLSDGSTYPAALIYTFPEQDLVLLKIDAADLPTASVGTSAEAAIGDSVVAIGTPGSVNFAGTVTYGYISGLDRQIEITDDKDAVIGYTNMIQITAPINPGNSGGPLINRFGEVIAINTMKLTGEGFEGMGFAIPIDAVYPTLQEQIDTHRAEVPVSADKTEVPTKSEITESDSEQTTDSSVTESVETEETVVDTRPMAVLGIRGETVTEKEALLYKMPVGVIIHYVDPGSDAELFDLRAGDIILSADGTAIPDIAALDAWMQNLRAGDTAEITVFRAGAELVINVTFSEPAEEVPTAA